MATDVLSAENAVIGSILVDPRCVPVIAATLRPEDMSNALYKAILTAAYRMHRDGEAIDYVTLAAEVKKLGAELSTELVVALMDATPTAANAETHAELVKSGAMRRDLRELGTYLTTEDINDPLDTANEADANLTRIRERTSAQIIGGMELAQDFLQHRIRMDTDRSAMFAKTGYPDLDKLLGGGLINEGLYILAARPGLGKTTFALAVAENMSKAAPVLFVTLEMSKKQLMAKRVARHTLINSNRVLMGDLTAEETSKCTLALSELSERGLCINRKPSATVAEIGAMASAISGLKCVVVDYLGLVRPASVRKSIYEQVTETSGALKTLARRLQVPILCLAQLNRENEKRGSKRPMMSDLRDSGAIEQDADGIILLHNESYYHDDRPTCQELEVILAKNRHGGTGTVKMAFFPSTSTITQAYAGR